MIELFEQPSLLVTSTQVLEQVVTNNSLNHDWARNQIVSRDGQTVFQGPKL